MALTLGSSYGKMFIEIPKGMLTDSVPGVIYTLLIRTEGISDARSVINTLIPALEEKFNAKTTYISVGDRDMILQIEGSPFVWSLLIPFIPSILALIGIVVAFVSVWSVITAIPNWVYALAAIGVGLIFIGPTVGKLLIPEGD